MKNAVASTVLIGFACSMCLGCASIVSGRRADISIDSYPTNAHVVVHDNEGKVVASTNTPGAVSLKRNRKYFLPARYTATFAAPGYETSFVPITSTMNPWILGNVIFGGLPGFVVDNATGAAWKPRTSQIHQHLTPMADENSLSSENEASPANAVQSTQDVADLPHSSSTDQAARQYAPIGIE